jgi:putative transposase
VSPTRRRHIVEKVQQEFNVSQRRACQALGIHRSAVRYQPRTSAKRQALVTRMHELARKHPRFGYRRVAILLRQEGWRVNTKRIHRLWRLEGLKVPKKQRKKRRLGSSANGCTRRRATCPNEVWSYDFVMDQTMDGRRLKILPIVDEFTRECLVMVVARRITAKDVVAVLARLFAQRGCPGHLRSDNGPEFIALAVKEWLDASKVATLYIEPGSPWENAYSESFNSRLGDEVLDRELFVSLKEAQVFLETHRRYYNDERPHSSLGYVAPAVFLAQWGQANVATLDQTAQPVQPVLS